MDNLLLSGRVEDERRLYDRLIGLSNDLGLLSEEYDLKNKRLVEIFLQAFFPTCPSSIRLMDFLAESLPSAVSEVERLG